MRLQSRAGSEGWLCCSCLLALAIAGPFSALFSFSSADFCFFFASTVHLFRLSVASLASPGLAEVHEAFLMGHLTVLFSCYCVTIAISARRFSGHLGDLLLTLPYLPRCFLSFSFNGLSFSRKHLFPALLSWTCLVDRDLSRSHVRSRSLGATTGALGRGSS